MTYLRIRRAFRRMDDDGNKSLSYEEFNKGIRETGLILNEEQTKQLFSRFDRDGSGTIDMSEFLIAIRVGNRRYFLFGFLQSRFESKFTNKNIYRKVTL